MAQTRRPKLSRETKQFIPKFAGDESRLWFVGTLAGKSHLLNEIALVKTIQLRIRLLTDLANLRDRTALQRFIPAWRSVIRPESEGDMIELRDELRIVWTKRAGPAAEKILNKWLSWRPSDELLRVYAALKAGKYGAESASDYVLFSCSIKAGGFVPDFQSLRAMLIQGVFENWEYFKYCANPDCATPYFIAKRKDQTVCDAEKCKAERQRIHALKWWKENRSKQARLKQ